MLFPGASSFPRPRVLAALSLIAFLAFTRPIAARAGAQIVNSNGSVQVQQGQSPELKGVPGTPYPLSEGDRVRTGPASAAVILLGDGSKVELGADSDFLIEVSTPGLTRIFLKVGLLRSWVKKLAMREFSVRTPTVVASVRGTEFRVQTQFDGRTAVDLFDGLLNVRDNRGRDFTLQPGERIEADFMGALSGPQKAELRRTAPPASTLQENARREVGLDMKKEEVLEAAARELKLAEYQQGKAMIDVNGYRVRLEQYILRPQPDQFKLVVLNERADRFDYFYYMGTFNKTLPTDLSLALRQLGGQLDSAPEYWLTGFETGRSNTRDSIREAALGGHSVDLNANGDVGDDVTAFFDPAADRYVDATGRSVFQTIFDKYGFYVNGTLKYGWTGANLQAYANRNWSVNTDPITGAVLGANLPIQSVTSTFPDPNRIHQNIYESYDDGTFVSWDNYIIDDEGKQAGIGDFAGVTTGSAFKQRLLGWNYEQVVTATEFQGRKIDLVVAPRIMIQVGLIP